MGAGRGDRAGRRRARRRALGRLPGGGLGLGKVLGLALVTWLVWLGGTTTIVPYGVGSAAGWSALVGALGLLAAVRRADAVRAARREQPRGFFARRRWRRLAARAPAEPDPLRRPLFWGAEAVFLAVFAATALLVSFAPDVWGTETPMDMAFLSALNRADTFPPADPWLAGADLNYYYLGHLGMAVLVKLSAVEARAGTTSRWRRWWRSRRARRSRGGHALGRRARAARRGRGGARRGGARRRRGQPGGRAAAGRGDRGR